MEVAAPTTLVVVPTSFLPLLLSLLLGAVVALLLRAACAVLQEPTSSYAQEVKFKEVLLLDSGAVVRVSIR